jgi:hypothetical protein
MDETQSISSSSRNTEEDVDNNLNTTTTSPKMYEYGYLDPTIGDICA